jgi:hypothetical protein
LTESVLSDIIEGTEGLDRFFSRAQGAWERTCGDYLWRALRAGLLGETHFDRLGPWWEGRGAAESAEIDQVGLLSGRVTLVASCKWRNEWAKPGDLNDLRRVSARIGAGEETCHVIFSRSEFDPTLAAIAEVEPVVLIDPSQMFAPDVVIPDPS